MKNALTIQTENVSSLGELLLEYLATDVLELHIALKGHRLQFGSMWILSITLQLNFPITD